ncbi:MAG: hypothetical protein IJ831_01235 [Spirochaetales bacterium]|nr:hypothetical protein [Spirochaetales bacterium]
MRKLFYVLVIVLIACALLCSCKQSKGKKLLKDTKAVGRDIGHGTRDAVKSLK